MDESKKHYLQQKKPDTKMCILQLYEVQEQENLIVGDRNEHGVMSRVEH